MAVPPPVGSLQARLTMPAGVLQACVRSPKEAALLLDFARIGARLDHVAELVVQHLDVQRAAQSAAHITTVPAPLAAPAPVLPRHMHGVMLTFAGFAVHRTSAALATLATRWDDAVQRLVGARDALERWVEINSQMAEILEDDGVSALAIQKQRLCVCCVLWVLWRGRGEWVDCVSAVCVTDCCVAVLLWCCVLCVVSSAQAEQRLLGAVDQVAAGLPPSRPSSQESVAPMATPDDSAAPPSSSVGSPSTAPGSGSSAATRRSHVRKRQRLLQNSQSQPDSGLVSPDGGGSVGGDRGEEDQGAAVPLAVGAAVAPTPPPPAPHAASAAPAASAATVAPVAPVAPVASAAAPSVAVPTTTEDADEPAASQSDAGAVAAAEQEGAAAAAEGAPLAVAATKAAAVAAPPPPPVQPETPRHDSTQITPGNTATSAGGAGPSPSM